jgi:hypothetical protein
MGRKSRKTLGKGAATERSAVDGNRRTLDNGRQENEKLPPEQARKVELLRRKSKMTSWNRRGYLGFAEIGVEHP